MKFTVPIKCGVYREFEIYQFANKPVRYKPVSIIRLNNYLEEVTLEFDDNTLSRLEAPIYNSNVKLWNFKGNAVNNVNEYKEKLKHMLENLANPN